MVRRTRDSLECATTKLTGKKNDVVDFDDNDVFVGPVSVVGAFKSRLHEYSVSFPVTAHDTCSIHASGDGRIVSVSHCRLLRPITTHPPKAIDRIYLHH